MAMDPGDPSRLVAGIGRYSAFAEGGALTGLILTDDAGATWQVINDPLLVGRNISGVSINGDLILAAAGGGFYLSDPTPVGRSISQHRRRRVVGKHRAVLDATPTSPTNRSVSTSSIWWRIPPIRSDTTPAWRTKASSAPTMAESIGPTPRRAIRGSASCCKSSTTTISI